MGEEALLLEFFLHDGEDFGIGGDHAVAGNSAQVEERLLAIFADDAIGLWYANA